MGRYRSYGKRPRKRNRHVEQRLPPVPPTTIRRTRGVKPCALKTRRNRMSQSPRPPFTRRSFLQTTAAGVASAAFARSVLAQAQDDAVTAAQQSGKKIGYAVMGLGQLGLGQIVPAFKDCKLARLTALVSGSPDKAKQTA